MTELNAVVREARNAAPDQSPNVPSEQPILDEAWAIAIDLRDELGIEEAIVWADAYLDDVRERESSTAVARWAVVISALSELARSRVH